MQTLEAHPQETPHSPEDLNADVADLELTMAITRLDVNDDGSNLAVEERGGRIADAMERYETALRSGVTMDPHPITGHLHGTDTKDNYTLRPILAHFRTYAATGSREVHDEIAASPALQDTLRLYGAVESSLAGDDDKARTILGEVASQHLRSRLETQLSEAAQLKAKERETLAISDEQSAANLDKFLHELARHTVSADVITEEAAKIDTESVHIGVNRSLRAVKAMFEPGSNGRLMNQTEVAAIRSSNTGNAPKANKLAAESMLGYQHHENMFMPPLVYGALTSEHVHGGGTASAYGEVTVELTEAAEARATYTAGDSSDRLFSPGRTVSHAKEIQLNHDDAVKGYTYYLAHRNPQFTKQMYIEAQIAGVSVQDVERVTLPSIAEGSPSKHSPAEILELANAVAAQGKKVRIAYEMAPHYESGKVVGESLEDFTARIQAVNPAFEVEDRRTLRQIEYAERNGYISTAEADAQATARAAELSAKYNISPYGSIDVEA